jgi:glycosyltransferase involved in cell wall biosynthesis
LTEELVSRGHEVTLFASGDSQTAAKLVPGAPEGLRLAKSKDPLAPHLRMMEDIARRGLEFDIIHFHVDYLHFAVTRRSSYTHVSTLHGRLDIPDAMQLYRAYPEMPLISISDAQREPLPELEWAATIHHGLPADLYHLGDGGDYLAFVGRISPEKRLDRAIEIARRARLPLRVAAKIDAADREYYEDEIKPLLRTGDIELVGEIGEHEKQAFFGNARALVFPIDWPEPFGLVMIEAMATGTPVIAFRRGSIPEVIDEGVTGFVVDDLDQAVRAVERAGSLSRATIRHEFERRFTAARMADQHLETYRHLIARNHDGRHATAAAVAGLLRPGNQRAS